MQCLGPLSVYINRAGEICWMEPYFAINVSATSCTSLKAEEGLMTVIFNKTFGSPQYYESLILSPIWLIKIRVGINDKFEKSWSATWKSLFFQQVPNAHKVKWETRFSNQCFMFVVGTNKTGQIADRRSILPGVFIDSPSIVNIVMCFSYHALLNHIFNRKSTHVVSCRMCCSIFWPKLQLRPGKWWHFIGC